MRNLPFGSGSTLALLLLAPTLFGQESSSGSLMMQRPPVRSVRASAEATVSAKPDHAQIRIGVTSQAATAQAAAQQNAEKTAQVLAAMKKAIGKNGEVKTSNYSVNPQYKYGSGAVPKLLGYGVSNTVVVDLDQLSVISDVIDASVRAGANNVNGVSFTLKNEGEVRQRAISEATTKAKVNAEAIAKALGVQVIGVLEATTEIAIEPRRFNAIPQLAQTVEVATPTPIEVGNIDIRVSVTVSLEIR